MISLIGATGFLGPLVLEKLLKKGYEVDCLVRTSSNTSKLEEAAIKSGKKVTFSHANLNSTDSMILPLKNSECSVYMVDLESSALLENFMDAARRAGLKRAVFISSTTVLIPLDSKIKNNKIASENLIKKSKLDYTILRPSMIYGSGDDENFSKMIGFIKKKGYFVTFGTGNNLIQPVYIGDVADAVASVIHNEKTFNKTYNLSGKSPLTYNNMLEIVKEKLNREFRVFKIPVGLGKFLVSAYSLFSKAPDLSTDQIERMRIDKSYSHEDAATDFGFSPLGFDEGIEKFIKEPDS
jgi:nucleoside-diphosphate-sugar epimerase